MKTKKITTLSMLTAISLVIFIVEAQLPPLAPIPGIKIGLANIVTLLALSLYGRKEAFTVLMLRIILGSVFTGQLTSFAYSVAGGLMCFIVMSVLVGFFKGNQLWIVSVFGAIAHNIGQIAVAMAVTATWQIIGYFPILMISGIIAGAFTGTAVCMILKNKQIASRRECG